MSMQVWLFRTVVSEDESLSAVLVFHSQINTVTLFFFFCTLPTENIRTQNFFLFPKQEVTYEQNSRGKKLADK